MPDLQKDDTEFRIGLVMAGAISAGAYTAGVMDFMIEAIRAWEDAKGTRPDEVPGHKIRFDALSGASAGGICAALFASMLRGQFDGVRSATPDRQTDNPFYRAWVLDVGIDALLDDYDLRRLPEGEAPRSLLNVEGDNGLEGIRDRALDVSGGGNWPGWLRDPLPIFLSLTNLRGVPYGLMFAGDAGTEHGMSWHKDHIAFSLSAQGRTHGQDDVPLAFETAGRQGAWSELGEAALATSAFPGAFKARRLSRKAGLYDRRRWSVPLAAPVDGHCARQIPIAAHWPPQHVPDADGYEYAFWSYDGGVMDNEPMELARRAITDDSGRNNRDPDKATRMVVMVDPFPATAPFQHPYEDDGGLVGSLMALFGALTQQARFKPDDLALFRNESVFSRFVIAPSRWTTNARGERIKATNPLACGSLGAFGGMLELGWRHHDYLLGRLNCQSFLSRWFAVDASHRLIAGTGGRDPLGQGYHFTRDDGRTYAQIIPLMPEMRGPAAITGEPGDGPDARVSLPWPRGYSAADADVLTDRIVKRLQKVVAAELAVQEHRADAEIDGNWLTKPWKRLKNKTKWNWGAKTAANAGIAILARGKIRKALEDNLRQAELWRDA